MNRLTINRFAVAGPETPLEVDILYSELYDMNNVCIGIRVTANANQNMSSVYSETYGEITSSEWSSEWPTKTAQKDYWENTTETVTFNSKFEKSYTTTISINEIDEYPSTEPLPTPTFDFINKLKYGLFDGCDLKNIILDKRHIAQIYYNNELLWGYDIKSINPDIPILDIYLLAGRAVYFEYQGPGPFTAMTDARDSFFNFEDTCTETRAIIDEVTTAIGTVNPDEGSELTAFLNLGNLLDRIGWTGYYCQEEYGQPAGQTAIDYLSNFHITTNFSQGDGPYSPNPQSFNLICNELTQYTTQDVSRLKLMIVDNNDATIYITDVANGFNPGTGKINAFGTVGFVALIEYGTAKVNFEVTTPYEEKEFSFGETNMTWEQFCNSSYNQHGYYVSNGIVYYNYNNNIVLNDINVLSSDIIQNGGKYTTV